MGQSLDKSELPDTSESDTRMTPTTDSASEPNEKDVNNESVKTKDLTGAVDRGRGTQHFSRGHGRGRGRGRGRGDGNRNQETEKEGQGNAGRISGKGANCRGRERGRGITRQIKTKEDNYDEEPLPNVDENLVFQFIVQKFGGGCTLSDFIQQCDLLPEDSNVTRWFTNHSRRFHLFKDNNELVYIKTFHRQVKICLQYNRKMNPGKCGKSECEFFHVCQRYTRDKCKNTNCSMLHGFTDEHNVQLKAEMDISQYSDEEIKTILNCNFPSLCKDYIYNKGCKNVNSEKRCPDLHLCDNYVFKKCTDPCNMKLAHSLQQFHNNWVLSSYHMDNREKWPEARVLQSIIIPTKDQEHSGQNESNGRNEGEKLQQKTTIFKKNPSDPDFQEEDQSLLAEDAFSVSICPSVKKDKCKSRLCRNHHLQSGFPYLWQIKFKGKWLSFTVIDNENLERAFSDLKDNTDTKMKYNDIDYSFKATFNSPMSAIVTESNGKAADCCDKLDVRRLSTISFAEKRMSADNFVTQWRWYWKNDSQNWTIYEPDVFQFSLEKKFLTNQKTYLFMRDYQYRITYKSMIQTNLDNNRCREIIRRPLFVSRTDVIESKFPTSIPFPFAMGTNKPQHFQEWDSAHAFELVELDSADDDFHEVTKSFKDSLGSQSANIMCIYRVQNSKLWSGYVTKRNDMITNAEQAGRNRRIDERNLFHGTDSFNTCKGICTNNFDFRTSGRNGTAYGNGSYFAVQASYSHSYAKPETSTQARYMFRAKVLVGQYTQGNSAFRRPPEIPGQQHILYDSCVNSTDNPSMFIIFERNQHYPEYLIKYK